MLKGIRFGFGAGVIAIGILIINQVPHLLGGVIGAICIAIGIGVIVWE